MPESVADPRGAQREDPERDVGALFRAHAAFVFRSLRRLGVADGQVDDAVQEVFLVVHRRIDEWESRAPIRAWLYGIARRVASHVHRAQGRAAARQQAPEPPDEHRTPEHVLAAREDLDFVRSFLGQQSEGKRSVFVLIELEGMTAPEVAAAMDIRLNTVYSRLRVTRAAFAKAVARRARGHGVSDGTAR